VVLDRLVVVNRVTSPLGLCQGADVSASPALPDLEELCRLEREGRRLKFLFFWGHQLPRDGGVGPGCLSQWWPAEFTVDGVTYRNAEQYMMAGKARLFGDTDVAGQIMATSEPGAAKALGRQVAGFDEQTWADHRYRIVVDANTAKFGQDPFLRDYLAATVGRVLVEASPRDRIWGIGLSAGDERASRPSQWRGLNLLGFALMEARAALSRQ
jgi:ribA/ribD-fused uncharacterized protein